MFQSISDESPPPPRCQDKGKESEDMHCVYWKTLGHCRTKKAYMAKYCADTCELCDYDPSASSKGGNRGRSEKRRRGRGGKSRF